MNPRLIKLLMLSQSPNDNEALAAIRKANELLKEENKSWETAFEDKWAAEYEKLRLQYNDLVNRYNTLAAVTRISLTRPQKKKLFGLF